MAKNAIREYSTTAAANTDIGGIGVQGSNAVSNFDNAFRTIMAQLADMNGGVSPIDDTFTLCDPTDPTKRARFDVGGVATATTRVFTLPNYDLTFGTAAGQNIGTSGANVPLLNGNNVFSGTSNFAAPGVGATPTGTFANGKAMAFGDSDTGIRQSADGVLEIWSNDTLVAQFASGNFIRFGASGSVFTYDGNTIWHAGNDGPGSGLNADLLDGFSASTTTGVNTVAVRDAAGNLLARDIYPDRGDNTGAIVFPGSSKYIYWDGTYVQIQGGDVYVGTARYQQDGNIYFSGGMQTSFGTDLGAALQARAQIYTGSNANETALPIGHPLIAAGNIDRNASTSVWHNSGNNLDYTTTASGSQLAGTYRGRGRHAAGSTLLQRTA